MKRIFDVIAASFGLILVSPILLIAAVAIKLDSPGPVLYRSRRVGKNGTSFAMLKLRTMVEDAEDMGPELTGSGDPRITRVGRHLRHWKIDELPQLVNVLRGEMSFVGPRPECPKYVSRYTADQLRILAIKPGITGPSQVMFRHEETLLQNCDDLEAVYLTRILPEKLAIDLTYVDKNHSLFKDLWLIMLTLLCLFKRAKQDDCDAPSGRKEHPAGEMPASSRVPRC